ncbi:MAG: hypothetical protein JW888_18565, partial [Pirellulales bacterium]|nr:hypothetical protein [Pirellulales bacterium]
MDDSQGPAKLSRPWADCPPSTDGGRTIWLDGDVLACVCPQCGAPMSIRLWLMTADCFRCGTSIELTESQQREAQRLLQARDEARHQETHRAAAVIRPTATPIKSHPAHAAAVAPPHAKPPRKTTTRGRANQTPGAETRRRCEHTRAPVQSNHFLRFLPAWFVSLVLHTVAVLLLGLWTLEGPRSALNIHLSTAVGYQDLLGDETIVEDPFDDAFEFDDAGSTEPVDLPVDLV